MTIFPRMMHSLGLLTAAYSFENCCKSPFKWRHYQSEIILQCVRWYLSYPLSYRQVVEMVNERGLEIHHTTLFRWVQEYSPEIDKRFRPHLRLTNDSWRVDETYILVKGKQKEFMNKFFEAKLYTPTGIVSSESVYDEIVKRAETDKLPFPPEFEKLNKALAGGIPFGFIVALLELLKLPKGKTFQNPKSKIQNPKWYEAAGK